MEIVSCSLLNTNNKLSKQVVRVVCLVCLAILYISCNENINLDQQAKERIGDLERLMEEAKGNSLDVTREETLLWF